MAKLQTITLTHWLLGDLKEILFKQIEADLMAGVSLVKLPLDKRHRPVLMISHY